MHVWQICAMSVAVAVGVLWLSAAMAAEAPAAPGADAPSLLRSASRTVTVGPDGGDVQGADSFALQKAADRLAGMAPEARGILKILPGTYTMHDSLHVRVPMKIVGEPGKTVLTKPAQFVTTLAEPMPVDAVDLAVRDASGLRVGGGITIRPENERAAWNLVIRTIVAISGNTIRIDRPPASEPVYGRPTRAYPAGSVVQTSYPLISCRSVNDVEIEGLVVDGNLEQNRDMYIDGCRNGAVYFLQGKDHAVRRCVIRNFAGDGISWQTVHNMLVEEVESHGHLGFGLHPGTGSLYTAIRNCRAHHNGDIGLFVCWNVRFGRFEQNVLEDNGNHGISIGHNDTDNLFAGNQVRRNGHTGVVFRKDGPRPDRCVFEKNVIEDNGQDGKDGRPAREGFGILWTQPVNDVVLRGNVIRDTRPEGRRTQLTAIHVHSQAKGVVVAQDNTLDGKVDLPAAAPGTHSGN